MTTIEKLEALRKTVEEQTKAFIAREYSQQQADTYISNLHVGKKYARVDVGPYCNISGKYMIDMQTGEIFGIKAYGVIHKGHFYGTLDTINEWNWGGFIASKRTI